MTSALSDRRLRRHRPHRRVAAADGGLIAALIAIPLVAAVAGGTVWIVTQTGRATPPAVGSVEFTEPLRIPPLAPSRVENGVRVFQLEAAAGETAFVGQGPTPTLGYNGTYLGPTLVAERGERVRVDVANGLDEQTTVHWHGMHLPAAADGGPHTPIAAGGTWHPEWTIDQPAATLWYHPHLHGRDPGTGRCRAGRDVPRPDDDESALPLPRDYGVDDVPVIVQDRSFAGDGSFSGGLGMQFDGVLGDTILVNGTIAPFLDVTTERVRLRLLNGSSARMYDFAFADGRSFALVATDGGLLEAPVTSTVHPALTGRARRDRRRRSRRASAPC